MKVLILAYDFPPLISIGGQRPYSWFKYLPESGMQTTVITRHWTDKIATPEDYAEPSPRGVSKETDQRGNTIYRVPNFPNVRDKILTTFGYNRLVRLRKTITYFYTFLEHQFDFFDNRMVVYRTAQKAIKENRPDVIIATGEPFILFKYAHRLSAQYNIPWVADYRDSWTTNQGQYELGNLGTRQLKFFGEKEQLYLNNCSLVTTPSPTYAHALSKVLPGKNVQTVFNGYDEHFFEGLDNIQPPADKFVMTYAGTIYPHQNLELFLAGLKQFVEGEKITPRQFQLQFFGLASQQESRERLLGYDSGLNAFFKIEARIPYAEIVRKMRASHLLLLLSKKGIDWLNAKVFDYIAVKRDILLAENDAGILSSILQETNSGFAANSAEEVAEYLKKEYEKFKNGVVSGSQANDAYLKYSRHHQAAVMAGLLKQLKP